LGSVLFLASDSVFASVLESIYAAVLSFGMTFIFPVVFMLVLIALPFRFDSRLRSGLANQ
jgi:pilus assembly protein TadC